MKNNVPNANKYSYNQQQYKPEIKKKNSPHITVLPTTKTFS
jgi:hypothetical protein